MATATIVSIICDQNSIPNPRNQISETLRISARVGHKIHSFQSASNRTHSCGQRRRLRVVAITEGSAKKPSDSEEAIPAWARADSEEPPPWARGEGGENSPLKESFEIPFYVYLLSSAIIAIAAIGSIFEYVNKKPVFGIVNPDSSFYAPLLGFFVFTGIPTAAFLWFKSVEVANKDAEEQDRRDGYF